MPVYNIPTILDAFELFGDRFTDAQLLIKHMGERVGADELPRLPHPERVQLVGNVPYAADG